MIRLLQNGILHINEVKRVELPETIVNLNQRLSDYYGLFESGQPNYRIIWSTDEYEIRLTDNKGFQEVPKYMYARDRFILEKLIPTPELNSNELISRLTYEPLWVFEDRHGNPLSPIWQAIEMIISTVNRQLAEAGRMGVKYKDPESDPNEAIEAKSKRVDSLLDDLFGNETAIGDALAHGYGVVVPNSYKDKQ